MRDATSVSGRPYHPEPVSGSKAERSARARTRAPSISPRPIDSRRCSADRRSVGAAWSRRPHGRSLAGRTCGGRHRRMPRWTGHLLPADDFRHVWQYSTIIIQVGVQLDDQGLLAAACVNELHELRCDACRRVALLVSPGTRRARDDRHPNGQPRLASGSRDRSRSGAPVTERGGHSSSAWTRPERVCACEAGTSEDRVPRWTRKSPKGFDELQRVDSNHGPSG